jgi:hypothetical protein
MAHYIQSCAFAIIILLFGWLLDRAYGLITRATLRCTLMGIHWAFTGTYSGTVDLTCIAHPCSDTYGCTLSEEIFRLTQRLPLRVESVEMAEDI